MARRYSYDKSAGALFKPAAGPAFFDEWTEQDVATDDLLCAEMSRLAYATEPVVREALRSVGFSLVEFIGTEGLRGDLAGGTQVFVAQRESLLVIAFRGTESGSVVDMVTDAKIWPREWEGGGKVHSGFADAYTKDGVRERLRARAARHEGRILLTGHSLGAALATLAALDMSHATLVNFGSPRVGDAAFCQRFTDQGITVRRYVDCCDVVARVPPERIDTAHLLEFVAELANNPTIARWVHRDEDDAAPYQHVCPATYIDKAGTIHEPGTIAIEAVREDQSAARSAYPSVGSQVRDALALVTSAISTHRERAEDKGHLASILEAMIQLSRERTVAIRDLADHTPINYVSAFTGRIES